MDDSQRQAYCLIPSEVGVKVAIVGLSPATHDKAPWGEPGWEIWGLPWDDAGWPHMTRHFEMHDMRLLESEHSKRGDAYWQRLAECDRLYMQDDTLPNAIPYPFDEVAQTTGYYWNSSIAYALALAIHEGAEEIGVYGVDMKGDDEYGYQKPNVEYLLGLAKGRGIKVHVPEESPLLKFTGKGVMFFDHAPQYIKRYGWLG
jgi:hypothetical protein